MTTVKRNERKGMKQRRSAMSTQTKDFIQKICYRKTASIDMTRHGFVNDSKLHPINLMMKPLRAQLEKICGKPSKRSSMRENLPVQKKVRISLRATTAPRIPRAMIKPPQAIKKPPPQARIKPPRSPSHTTPSASSTPRTRALRHSGRKVAIAPPPSPIENIVKKSVRIIVPKDNKKFTHY